MTNIIKFFAFLLISLSFFFSGCDIIDNPIQSGGGIDTNQTDSNKRKVLIEEFTGFKCLECFDGAKEVHHLKELYGDRFFPVAVHGGSFARPDKDSNSNYRYDFRTTVSQELTSYYNVDAKGHPSALINRRKFGSDFVQFMSVWSDLVAEIMATDAVGAKIEINAELDTTSRNIIVNTNVSFTNAQTSQNKLSVWILEDSIVGWQKTNVEPFDIENYMHNNVIRYSFNETWGEDIALDLFKFEKQYTYSIPANDWKFKNLQVIAFVYNDEEGVIDVNEAKIKLK